MSMQYIRDYYKVPAKRGARIKYSPSDGEACFGTVVASDGQYIIVRFDGKKKSDTHRLHPKWQVTYLKPCQCNEYDYCETHGSQP